jgi:hypothetical protein
MLEKTAALRATSKEIHRTSEWKIVKVLVCKSTGTHNNQEPLKFR